MAEETILSVVDLHTSFTTDKGEVRAVNGVSFNLTAGKILGIVGESGSGKSVSAYSIMQILEKNGSIKSGQILYKGEDITKWPESRMRDFRGKRCSIIFQDPMTSLNPVFTIGYQLEEAIKLHTDRRGKEARDRAIEMLELVGVNEPQKRIKQYPFEFSGGMRQRVMIAMALACEPDILIADEPTTALDVTIQAQILELMKDLQAKLGMAIIMVTHDLGVNQGTSAFDPERGHHGTAPGTDIRYADQSSEHAERLRVLSPLRRGDEDLPGGAAARDTNRRRTSGCLLAGDPRGDGSGNDPR